MMNELNDLQVSGEIVNRVANSNLQVFNLEDLYDPHERVVLDIKDQLYMGMILSRKRFQRVYQKP